jgi:hypothetical protein
VHRGVDNSSWTVGGGTARAGQHPLIGRIALDHCQRGVEQTPMDADGDVQLEVEVAPTVVTVDNPLVTEARRAA